MKILEPVLIWSMAFALTALGAPDPTPQVQTSLDEIELLVGKKSFSEASFHLKSVPPSDRGKRFETLAEKSFLGEIEAMVKEKMGGADRRATSYLMEYPFLQRSAAFMKVWRTQIAEAYVFCAKNRTAAKSCWPDLVDALQWDLGNSDFIRKSAKLIAQNEGQVPAYAAWKLLLNPAAPKAFCEDPEIHKSLQATADGPAGPFRTSARRLLRGPCQNAVAPTTNKP